MLVLDRWPIELPAGLKLGPRVEMPLVLENDLSAFRFDTHDTLGAVLSSVTCKKGSQTFEFRTTPDPRLDAGERNLGLWEMNCGLEHGDDDKPVTVTPEQASEFECHSVRSMSGLRRGAAFSGEASGWAPRRTGTRSSSWHSWWSWTRAML